MILKYIFKLVFYKLTYISRKYLSNDHESRFIFNGIARYIAIVNKLILACLQHNMYDNKGT